MQRLLDVLLSGLALLVLSPLLVPVAIALRMTGEGEVFFIQQRVGRGGRPFGLYKFATMLKDSPNIGTGTVTVKGDPRVLPLGRLLRKTKINELPQLLNILKGDMSIIGPRPQTRRCFDAFPVRSQAAIVKVRPGLSGIGSIVFRDEEGNIKRRIDMGYRKLRLGVEYDGRQHAENDEQWQNDIDRREEFDELEWRLIILRSPDLFVRPDLALARVAKALASKGVIVHLKQDWRRHFPVRRAAA